MNNQPMTPGNDWLSPGSTPENWGRDPNWEWWEILVALVAGISGWAALLWVLG